MATLRWLCVVLAASVQRVTPTVYYMDDTGTDCNPDMKVVNSGASFVKAWRWLPRYFYGQCTMHFVTNAKEYNALRVTFLNLTIQSDDDVALTFYDANSTDDYEKQLASFTYSDSHKIPKYIQTTGRYLSVALNRVFNSIHYNFNVEIKPVYIKHDSGGKSSAIGIAVGAGLAALLVIIVGVTVGVVCVCKKQKQRKANSLINDSSGSSTKSDYNSINEPRHIQHFPKCVEPPPAFAPAFVPNMPNAPALAHQDHVYQDMQQHGYQDYGDPYQQYSGYSSMDYTQGGAAVHQSHWPYEKPPFDSQSTAAQYYGHPEHQGQYEHVQSNNVPPPYGGTLYPTLHDVPSEYLHTINRR
ncbi:uncharacterized protein LOC106180435 [Lingula anatina]|uniref:Uncharacterized protein LOC106180435 n=1 Tax=Lingula anatina TaxID=7574 RepID=A0A1S3KB59_LINAN|nr:uncharacterized protein LOC106180435 [Lingula anatina]|eukprot:XP_013419870.1 uncharacterized protein LOC106180435 [Lingula anatina]